MTEPAGRKDSIVARNGGALVAPESVLLLSARKLSHEDFGPQHIDANALEDVHRPVERQREGNEIISSLMSALWSTSQK